MNINFKARISILMILSLVISILVPMQVRAQENETNITILGTSDLHGRIFPWDYALDSEDLSAGYLKVATVVKDVKSKNKNVIVVDNGDTIQDNSIELFQKEDKNPIIEVMNDIGYDSWTLGNHEFNFGLDVLDRAVKTSKATVLAGNIYKENGQRAYSPYKIIEKDGVKVALIGMITPNISRWEASTPDHFKGLTFKNPVEETKKIIAELKGKADVFVGVMHMGVDAEYSDFDGMKAVIAQNPELDVCVVGHAHSDIAGMKIGNTLVVEPKSFGSKVSKIDLKLKNENGKWTVVDKNSENIDTKAVAVDKELEEKYKRIHEVSRKDANTVIGKVADDYIKGVEVLPGIPKAQLEDTALIDLINEVQMYYTKADVSAAAAFKNDMNIVKGDFKKKDVANIYKYANTLIGLKVNGKQLKKYMEWSASYYNTAKPGDVTVSFNKDIRGYNYDMFSGVTYDVDISKPEGQRITNLSFKGKPVTDDMKLTLAVNNYRYGSMVKDGYFNAADKIYDSSDKYADGSIRNLIVQYVTEKKNMTPKVDNNWKLIGTYENNQYKEAIYNLVKDNKVKIPAAEDGRTPNVKALNSDELLKSGIITTADAKAPVKVEQPKVIVSTPAPVEQPKVIAPTPVKIEQPKIVAPTPITIEKAKPANTTYTVKKGDMIYKIAKKFSMDYKKLSDFNNLVNPNKISINQLIKIPVVQ